MQVRDIDRGELLAAVGGALVIVSLFLTWYSLGNKYAYVAACRYPHAGCSGWESLGVIRYLLLIAAIVPAILLYVVVFARRLSWPRGELTAVIALCALTLIIFRGIIDRPGFPSGEVTISLGWFVALLGGLLILLGALVRTRESGRRRKPPGML